MLCLLFMSGVHGRLGHLLAAFIRVLESVWDQGNIV